MSDHEHYDGAYASGTGYEPDVGARPTAMIFGYIIVLSALFFVSCGALYVYFKWEAEAELERKVYSAESVELNALRTEEQKALGGIDKAMKAVASESR